MRSRIAVLFLSCIGSVYLLIGQENAPEADLMARAHQLAQRFIVVDTHIDVPYRLREKWEDISARTPGGNFDYPRARQGGLNAPFMSIYVPSEYDRAGAKALADTLIDMVEGLAKRWSNKFAIATSVDDVRKQFKSGKISLCLGMENGSPIEHNLENLKHFHRRGIRYITLTHARDNHICDSSYDTTRTWRGLSPFGRTVVLEMNRLGVMVDVSHISDEAFFEVMNITRAPVIASHSSCRHFTPGWERNMSDEMIRLLARSGGVIMINFGSAFIHGEYQRLETQIWNYVSRNNLKFTDPAAQEFIRDFLKKNPLPAVDVSHVADHIDHVVRLAGIDHVGLGSDFDGVGDSLPDRLKDVSQYPNLIYELLRRGYSDSDIRKVCGENLLRVWSEVESTAKRLQAMK